MPAASSILAWTGTPLCRALLLCLHILACCGSLAFVTWHYGYFNVVHWDEARLPAAVLSVLPLFAMSPLFVFGRFSLGYFIAFYLFTSLGGYLWLSAFSILPYDHAGVVVAMSAALLAFSAPAVLLVRQSSPKEELLSSRGFDVLLTAIMVFAAVTLVISAAFHFRMTNLANIYEFRNEVEFPRLLAYAIGIASNALLPFSFACALARGHLWRAALALLLLLGFYPVTLTKVALFGPLWLVLLGVWSSRMEARAAVIASLLIPIVIGLIVVTLFDLDVVPRSFFLTYFGSINFRMVAFPAMVLDAYTDFFSRHSNTHFCQILFLKPLLSCPYSDPLSVLMGKNYGLGNMNASLFATEGIASVGPMLTPLVALAAGSVVAAANWFSAGLPPRLVIVSAGIFAQVLLNVPLTTSLLTNGGAVLVLLWYVTPRSIFECKPKQAA